MAIVQSNGAATSSQNGGGEETESDDIDPMIAPLSSDSSDLDSGMESDEPDITSFLEPGTELCQVGNQTLALPIDLCELPNLGEILSIETWNDLLSDSDRFELAKYLPDMDEETFTLTLSQLFKGENLNFGNPLEHFFKQLKGGQCDPRVTLYRKGMNVIQKGGYYCNLRKYQDSMVSEILSIKEALQNCDESYGIEERIRFANIIRNQEALASDSDEETELEFESESESGYKSDSELENSDNSVELPKVNLRKDFANGLPKRKNQKLGFAKIGKLGRNKPQLRYESEEEETEEREHPKSFVSSHRFRGKIKSKNRKNLDLVKVKGPKQKSVNTQRWINEERIDILSPEMNNLPNKSEEETESDLSQKERAIERIIIDSEKPKKKTKKGNKKDKKVKKEKIVKKRKKEKKEKKVLPRGRKGGRKRKSEDLVNVEINNSNNEHTTNIDDNINNNNIMKIETNVDENLVEIPVLQETEQKPLKRRKKKTLISESENNNQKKRKRKNEQNDSEKSEPDKSNLSKKKKGRKKSEIVPDLVPLEQVKQEEIIPVLEPPKKKYIPIKPTIHTDFSFSIIHLLSSVRIAMINSKLNNNNNNNNNDNNNTVQNSGIKSEEQSDSPAVATSLTAQQIAERVRSDPLDPSVLTAQEPLDDLIKGVVRILSSKQAPLGFKQWKPLVSHISSTKTWYWTGTVIPPTGDQESQEPTSPDAWGLPHKSLVKLVDSFANWLKQGEETLKKLGGLGPPPVPIHATLTEKDRFKDIKSLKSQYTIPQTCQETKSYFQKEEQIRYSIPDRAFSYTATDGRKSTVAPLGRSSNKQPNKKARGHFMLKPDRPPHVTILGLVRDAAARLPGSIGTRADVCTLIRDSQFVIADVAEEKISEVVSGALDRLHYQEDPCVRFDGERKLWVYLHREREEEDFEDDGNQSTKKWRKPKKESADLDAEGRDGNNVGGGELNYDEDYQTGQDDQLVGQAGQDDQAGVVQAGQMGQEDQFVGGTSQMGRENQLVGQMGQENQFVGQTGQTGQENLFGFQMGQTSRVDQLWGQTGQESEESVDLFGGQRRLGFFHTTL